MGVFLSEVHSKIKKELEKRMDVTKRDLKGIYARSVWMRAWSPSDKKTIMCGGLLDGTKTRSGFDKIYSPKNEEAEKPSFLPTPGVTNISVDYKGDFGSLRECTIKWVCWSFEDLDKMTPLFLTAGKSVVVEWGWSTGDKEQTVGLDPSQVCDIYKDAGMIRKKVIESGGNFDAMLGLVTHWDWKLRDDGGIDVTTKLTSHGTGLLDEEVKPADGQKDGDREKMFEFVKALYTRIKNDYGDEYKGDDGSAAQYVSDEEAYVSWGFIEDEIITKHTTFETAAGVKMPVMKSVSYDNDGKEDGPTLIYRPPKLENLKGDILKIDAGGPFESFSSKKNDGAPLRFLVLNVKIVQEAFEIANTLQDALEKLFTDMNDAACDVWDFRIVSHEEKPGEMGVIDANWGENTVSKMKDKAFIFPTWRRDSIVRSQTMDASVPDALATTIVYGANQPKDDKADAPNKSGQEAAKKLSKKDPKDPCLNKPKRAPEAKERDNAESSDYGSSSTDSQIGVSEATGKDRVQDADATEETKLSDEQAKLCKDIQKEKAEKVPFVYPINLELTTDGIAGIIWGNTIHTAFIPKIYKDNVVFQVTTVQHEINTGDWETTISTVCRIAPPKG